MTRTDKISDKEDSHEELLDGDRHWRRKVRLNWQGDLNSDENTCDEAAWGLQRNAERAHTRARTTTTGQCDRTNQQLKGKERLHFSDSKARGHSSPRTRTNAWTRDTARNTTQQHDARTGKEDTGSTASKGATQLKRKHRSQAQHNSQGKRHGPPARRPHDDDITQSPLGLARSIRSPTVERLRRSRVISTSYGASGVQQGKECVALESSPHSMEHQKSYSGESASL
jgi:hypothetical protein